MNLNAGDVIFQLIMFLFIFGIFFVVFFVVRSLLTKQKQPNKSNDIEQKLDRIIELLEQDKK
ncbi:MAG TPA: DUF4083 family protein [Metabacillus sp.]|nr:DUF4083 family protein [Metabacillus sp.]